MANDKRKGFTLVEVTIGILVVVTISAMTVMKFFYVIERARTVEAVKLLHDLKDYQITNMAMYGHYVGDGNIEDFPKLAFKGAQLEHFDRVEVTTDPFNVGKIYRNNQTYHLNITDLGVVYCVVDQGSMKLCEKLGFKDIKFRNINEAVDAGST